MKAKFFLLLFFCMPFLAYSQSKELPNIATYCGAIYVVPPSPSSPYYQFQGAPSIPMEIGNIFGQPVGIKRGRGFVLFQVSSIASTVNVNDITGGTIYFDCGNSYSSSGSHSVKFSKLSKSSLVMDYVIASTAYSEIGSSSNTLITTKSLSSNTTNNSVSLTKSDITTAYNSLQGLLPICLVHSDEVNNGIEIKNVKLVITYTVPVTKPNAPSNLQYSNVATNGCKLTWSAPSGGGAPDGYRVYNGSTKIGSDLSSSTTSTTITTLSPSTSYTVCVKAFNAGGESSCSNTVTFTTLSLPVIPGSISPSYQTFASGGSVNLSHTGASGVTSRQWQLSTNNGGTWTDITGATGTSYNTGTLTNSGTSNITRTYRVKVNGLASYSSESTITVTPPTPKITSSAIFLGGIYFIASATTTRFSVAPTPSGSYSWFLYRHPSTHCGTSNNVSYVDLISTVGTPGSGAYPHFLSVLNSSGEIIDQVPIIADGYDVVIKPPKMLSNPNDFLNVYPNPVSDILTIEIDPGEMDQSKNSEKEPTFDVRLYDGQGNILRQQKTQGGTVHFNVSNLSDVI